jgi:hypothetical protein
MSVAGGGLSRGALVDDLYDITRSVQWVRVAVPELGESVYAFSNGKSFFLDSEQVAALAATVGPSRLAPRAGGGWQEIVQDRGVRVLAERYIDGKLFYRFRQHWAFDPVHA